MGNPYLPNQDSIFPRKSEVFLPDEPSSKVRRGISFIADNLISRAKCHPANGQTHMS
jgi:hypothetical protein